MAQLSSTKTKTVKKSKRASGASDARRIQQGDGEGRLKVKDCAPVKKDHKRYIVREAQARFKARQKEHIETLEQQLIDLTAKIAERRQQSASPVDAPALSFVSSPDALAQPLQLAGSTNEYLSRRISELESENEVLRSMWMPVMDPLAFLSLRDVGGGPGAEDVKPFSNGALSPDSMNVSSFNSYFGENLISTSEPVIRDFDVKDENSPLGCVPGSLFPPLSFCP